MWTREQENVLLQRCVTASRQAVAPTNADEADVFRLVAQLVKTRHPKEALRLDQASRKFFQEHPGAFKKSYPEVVRAGLVRDLPRFRNLLDRQLTQVRTW